MVGRSPVAFLHLEVPPEEVDVNVHPMKIEVRFRDSQRIYSQLLATLRQTFLASDLHSKLQAPPIDVPETNRPPETTPYALPERPDQRQEVASWFAPKSAATFQSYPSPGYAGGPTTSDWGRSPYASAASPTLPTPSPQPPQSFEPFDEFAVSTPHPSPVENPVDPGPRPFDVRDLPVKALQVHDSYLVAETADGMVVIDQHALHERILYEELKLRIDRGGVESQRLLVAEPVELEASEASAILERREVLATLGLDVEDSGDGSVLVRSVPAMLPGVSPDRLLRDLADHFRSKPLPPTRDEILEDVLSMIACKAAVKAGQKLAADEVTALLDRRHLVTDAHHCPHGRPTALVFTKSELERQFGRI
jgi:DNA mismatch repair protein MutL